MRPPLTLVPVPLRPSPPEAREVAEAIGAPAARPLATWPGESLPVRRYWVCVPGPDGWPQATPVWGLRLDGAVVFSTDSESVAAGDPPEFPATVAHLESADRIVLVDGVAERIEDAAVLARFVAACEAKYGFELDAADPDTPVYAVRPQADIGREADEIAEAVADGRLEPAK